MTGISELLQQNNQKNYSTQGVENDASVMAPNLSLVSFDFDLCLSHPSCCDTVTFMVIYDCQVWLEFVG